MEKENDIDENIHSENEQKDNIEENLNLNKEKNDLPTTVTEVIESREQNALPISSIMPNIKEFFISFPTAGNEQQDNYNYNESNKELKDENKKIKISKKDLFKIFKMIKIPKDEIDPYILFSFTSIKSEVVSNIIKKYKVDFKKLMDLINNCYLQFGNKDDNMEVNKNSIMKIFDQLGLSPNNRLSYLQFYEVDEEVEYEEEEDENESEEEKEKEEEKGKEEEKEEEEEKVNKPLTTSKKNAKKERNSINNKNKVNPDFIFDIQKKTKTTTKSYPEENDENTNDDYNKGRKNNKIYKDKDNDNDNDNDNNNNNNYNVFENENENGKKIKSRNKIRNKNIDKNKENHHKPKPKSKPKNIKKPLNNKSRNKYFGAKDDNVENVEHNSINSHKKKSNKNLKPNNINDRYNRNREPKMFNSYNYNEKDNDSNFDDYSDNKSSKISNGLGNISKKNNSHQIDPTSPNDNNISRYTFITRKRPEHDNCIMYLAGSIPVLGNWNQNLAIPMDEEVKNDHIFYTKYLDIKKEDFPFEYKFFYIKDDKTKWLGRPNINHKSHKEYFNLYNIMKEKVNTLSIFDLNVRYLNKLDGLNIWDYRKEQLLKVLLKYVPDIFFFQEITRPQYQYLEENLDGVYENVGIYRDKSDHSEKCSISYNKIKFTLTDWGQFWLSSTPHVPGSNDFGNFFPRICTWALLRQVNGELFLFFNIHLDHANFKAHVPCIKVVLNESERILRRCPTIKMVFLGGCFYCEEDDALIQILKQAGYNEVMFENTFHDFTGDADRHWDYMFWKSIYHNDNDTDIQFKRAYLLKEDSIINLRNQQFISDHYPVIAEFEIESSNNNTNNDILYEENRKEFSELDEEDYLKNSPNLAHSRDKEKEKENHYYKDNNIMQNKEEIKEEKLNDYNNKQNNFNNNNENEEKEEEEEIVEIEEEIEENNENNNNDNEKKNKGDNVDNVNENNEDYKDEMNNEEEREEKEDDNPNIIKTEERGLTDIGPYEEQHEKEEEKEVEEEEEEEKEKEEEEEVEQEEEEQKDS